MGGGAQPNMVALWSFGVAVHREMGRPQFAAFYATSAVGASLVSHLTSVLPRLATRSASTRCATLLENPLLALHPPPPRC